MTSAAGVGEIYHWCGWPGMSVSSVIEDDGGIMRGQLAWTGSAKRVCTGRARPAPVVLGVLVLAGSSGRLPAGRADVLAAAGVTALALRWFGGVGQPAIPREVALETFSDALDLLQSECDGLAVLGHSYGAEAALLVAVRDRRLRAVVAIAPTDVVWEGARRSDGDPPASKWTWRGKPVPFVPLDRSWTSESEQPAFVSFYASSRDVAGLVWVGEATIPVERFGGELVVVAGGDDQVWPSAAAAAAIVARRAAHGLDSVVVEDGRAGHQLVFPGGIAVGLGRSYRVGGDA